LQEHNERDLPPYAEIPKAPGASDHGAARTAANAAAGGGSRDCTVTIAGNCDHAAAHTAADAAAGADSRDSTVPNASDCGHATARTAATRVMK